MKVYFVGVSYSTLIVDDFPAIAPFTFLPVLFKYCLKLELPLPLTLFLPVMSSLVP